MYERICTLRYNYYFLYAGIDEDTIENDGDVIETSGDDDTE